MSGVGEQVESLHLSHPGALHHLELLAGDLDAGTDPRVADLMGGGHASGAELAVTLLPTTSSGSPAWCFSTGSSGSSGCADGAPSPAREAGTHGWKTFCCPDIDVGDDVVLSARFLADPGGAAWALHPGEVGVVVGFDGSDPEVRGPRGTTAVLRREYVFPAAAPPRRGVLCFAWQVLKDPPAPPPRCATVTLRPQPPPPCAPGRLGRDADDVGALLGALFVYGTLRPDAAAHAGGASWTAAFVGGMGKRRAVLRGHRLYRCGHYPAICVPDGGAPVESAVHGWLLSCPGDAALWRHKLAAADAIEGAPHVYQRAAVRVDVVDPAPDEPGSVIALAYHRDILRQGHDYIPSGDWLQQGRPYTPP